MTTSTIITTIALALGFGIFESVWRRWFGGGFDYWWLKWINFRFVKHVINIAALFAVCHFWRGMTWQWSLYSSLIVQLLYWTLTFGMYFDIGRSGKPVTPEDIEAYNKPWFSGFLNWCFPGESRYSPFYDFCGMAIRFTWPLALVFFVPTFNSGIMLLGELVAMFYGIGWVMYSYDKSRKVQPTVLGEFLSGFATGLFMVLNGMVGRT